MMMILIKNSVSNRTSDYQKKIDGAQLEQLNVDGLVIHTDQYRHQSNNLETCKA